MINPDNASSSSTTTSDEIPHEYLCPITQEMMQDPVVAADGHTYERRAIEEWFRRGRRTSPMTNEPLPHINLVPNIALRNMIRTLTERLPFLQRRAQVETDYQFAVQVHIDELEMQLQKHPIPSSTSSAPEPTRRTSASNSQGFFQSSPQGLTAEFAGMTTATASTATRGAIPEEIPESRRRPQAGIISIPPINQVVVDQLLLHVAQGKQDEAEAMLKENPGLTLYKGTVTDYSNRMFKNITAFQYALWALDWHMWSMILNYLPVPEDDDAAKVQLEALESQGTAHGKHFDFRPLIMALEVYVKNCDAWNDQQCAQHWTKKVGGAQRKAPAHVADEYCRKGYSFPSFTADPLPRMVTAEIWNRSAWVHGVWYPLVPGAGVGFSFGFWHDNGGAVGLDGLRDGDESTYVERWHKFYCGPPREVGQGAAWTRGPRIGRLSGEAKPKGDLEWITALCKVRREQLESLKRQFSAAPVPRP